MSKPMPHMPVQFAAELGKGVALGLKALGPMKTPLMTQGGTTDTKGKQLYGEEDIAALFGSPLSGQATSYRTCRHISTRRAESLLMCIAGRSLPT
jgi:hypothetical protein